VIAYRGPVTGPEIQEIRGVNVSGVVKTLLEKRLIATAGRKAVMGRPIMYRTSKEFLMRFGLSDLEELPSLKEFEQLARAALGSDEGIAPIEPEQLEGEVPSSEQDATTESAEATEPSSQSQSEITDVNQPSAAAAEAPDSIATAESSEHGATEETNAVSDAPESMETIVERGTDEVDAVSETIPQQHQETPEAATADAEHSEEAKAESAS
jgi:segregation and condensation protein B